MSREEWRPVIGWEGYYEVSSDGLVRSIERTIQYADGRSRVYPSRIISPRDGGRSGHLIVSLSKNLYRRHFRVHTLVAEAFIGPRPAGTECCHNNGIASDNRVENLRWDTHTENMRDTVRHGIHNHARKTHCKRGHELREPNLTAFSAKRGIRACLACARARAYLQHHKLDLSHFPRVSNSYYQSIIQGVAA
ncbi:NUMOD4 motif-containing HNH endonuclease [Rhodococcus aetherivorans]|uniref:NUMOD4 motif-containing HNH endonuclease n=1 Tax=Rhodococcus aetherivorans TaxID=191292 RepID=UPI003EB80702